jgi:hypothetical protein
MGGDKMPKYNDMEKLKELLIENNVNPRDNHAKKRFYDKYYDWDSLCKEYDDGCTIKDICKKTNLSFDVVRARLKKYTHVRNSLDDGRYESDYDFDYDCLENLNKKGAYLLGWIYSDGNIRSSGRLKFHQQDSDRTHLEYIANLYSNKPVYENVNAWHFFSKRLYNILSDKYNISETKSMENYNIDFGKYSKEVIPYLLLGLFEGDGHISAVRPSSEMLMPEKSVISFLSTLENAGVNTEYHIARKLNKHGLVNVKFSGRSYFRYFEYLYNNTTEIKPLMRKYKRYLIQLDRSIEGRTSPYKWLARDIRDSLRIIEI